MASPTFTANFWTALLLAPLGTIPILAVFLLVNGGPSQAPSEFLRFLAMSFLTALPFGFIGVIVFGVPSHFALTKFRISMYLPYAMSGLVGGLCIGYYLSSGQMLDVIVLCTTSGVATASVFWLIIKWGKNEKDAI